MSIWDKIQELITTPEVKTSEESEVHAHKRDASLYAFVDAEVGMRTLANNMAWMLKKLHGVETTDAPECEPWNPMNFIR